MKDDDMTTLSFLCAVIKLGVLVLIALAAGLLLASLV
jgi:hypothetical protein